MCIYIYKMFVCLNIFLSSFVYLSINRQIELSFCFSYWPTDPIFLNFISVYLSLSPYHIISLTFCLSIKLSVCLYLSIDLPTYLCLYLSIYRVSPAPSRSSISSLSPSHSPSTSLSHTHTPLASPPFFSSPDSSFFRIPFC